MAEFLDTTISDILSGWLVDLLISAALFSMFQRFSSNMEPRNGKLRDLFLKGYTVRGQARLSFLDMLSKTLHRTRELAIEIFSASMVISKSRKKKEWSKRVRFFSKILGEENREAILGDLTERMNFLEENNYSRVKIWQELLVEILGLFCSDIYYRLTDFIGKGEKEVDK